MFENIISKELNDLILKNNLAREISKEIIKINNSDIFTYQNGLGSKYPIVTYFFDFNDLSPVIQDFLTKNNCQNCFSFFDSSKAVYKIYVSTYSKSFFDKSLQPTETLNFRKKQINVLDNFFELQKQVLLSTFRHELGHLKISDLENLNTIAKRAEKQGVPFNLVNLLEDVRVNAYWDKDSENYRIIMSEMWKVEEEDMTRNADPSMVLFDVCLSRDNPKYNFLSPYYPFIKNIYERAIIAKSTNEIVDLAKEFLDKIEKYTQKLKLPPQMKQSGDNEEQQFQTSQSPQNNESDTQSQEQEQNDRYKNNKGSDDVKNLQNNSGSSRLDDDESEEEFEKEVSSQEIESSRREVKDNFAEQQTDGSENQNDAENKNFSNDLLNAMSEEEIEQFERFIKKEIEANSFMINEDGLISNKKKILGECDSNNKSVSIYTHIDKDNDDTLLPLANEVTKGEILLNKKLLNILVELGKKELASFFPKTKMFKTRDVTQNLNISDLYSIPTNPQLENIFLKQAKPNIKEPIKFSIFVDLSGSMSGYPLNLAKHLIAFLKKMQNEKYIDTTLFFHAQKEWKDVCEVVELSKFKDKPFERISEMETFADEGIVNAIEIANQKYHSIIKNSRFVLFLTDACLCDSPEKIQKALKQIDTSKILGVYLGKYTEFSENQYFPNNISFKGDENIADEFLIANQLKSITKAICNLANPNETTAQCLIKCSKDNNLEVKYSNKKLYISSFKSAQKEQNSDVSLQEEPLINSGSSPKI